MLVNDAFPSKYLKTGDLKNRPWVLSINAVEVQTVDEKTGDQKPVVFFEKTGKGLVLNVTNANAIARLYGEEMNSWHGQVIELYPTETDFKGERVDCIRVRAPSNAAQPAAAPQPDPNVVLNQPIQAPVVGSHYNPDDLDDDIPF